jgi:hypothetical protein
MGAMEDKGPKACQRCHSRSPAVRERGRISLMAVLCDCCWNAYANELAAEEGATAPPRVDLGPDDITWHDPPTCDDCGAMVAHYPTNYDRWVYLAVNDLPAKDVAPRYRWRLKTLRNRLPSAALDVVAVRVRGIEPRPSDLVRAAHRAICLAPDAVLEAEHAWPQDHD